MNQSKKALVGSFNLPSEDPQRSIEFYRKLFAWDFTAKEKDGISYWEITRPSLTHSDIPQILGALICKKGPDDISTLYIQVENVEEYRKKIEILGGSVVKTSMSLPGGGLALLFQDFDGNYIVTWQEK